MPSKGVEDSAIKGVEESGERCSAEEASPRQEWLITKTKIGWRRVI
jgi:hypothetical protein